MERICTVEGCDKQARSGSADYCKMHYHRWYRHGSVDVNAHVSAPTASNGRRYQTHYRPRHPLAGKWGSVYIHREVLYDAIGLGPHPCHWCGASLDWLPKGDPRGIHVDHLNSFGDDNRIENLVPSCRTCNSTRGSQAKRNALAAAGWWSSHDTIARLSNGGRRPRIGDGDGPYSEAGP